MGPRHLVIKLVRHGESAANTKELDPKTHGEYRIPLTDRGREQAAAAGRKIGASFLEGALVYTSPYLRARQTLEALLAAAGGEQTRGGALGVYEDPRLREVDHGYADVKEQAGLRERHGWFYYRYTGGESPADCYDRVSGFLESMMRQVERKNAGRVLIVTHGLAMRCFVMRFMRMSVEDFENMKNPHNGDVITIAPGAAGDRGWSVDGVRWYGTP